MGRVIGVLIIICVIKIVENIFKVPIYVVPILGLVIWGLIWVRQSNWQRWVGAGILIAVPAYLIVPTQMMNLRNDRLDKRLSAASFWSETLSFAGANVLLVNDNADNCARLCKTLFTRSGLATLYQLDFDPRTPLTAQTLRDPKNIVTQVGIKVAKSGETYLHGTETKFPDNIDWVIWASPRPWYLTLNAASMGITPEDAENISRSLLIYRVELGQPDEPFTLTPVVRMYAWRHKKLDWNMPMFIYKVASQTKPVFGNALKQWVCAPATTSEKEPCPDLF